MKPDQLFLNRYVTTVVKSRRDLTPRIRLLELGDPDEWELPSFTEGAHIDIVMGPDLIRQYSLCGSAAVRNRYYIAVQKEEAGRGGSLHIHREYEVGSVVPVSLPRNLFPLDTSARHSVMVAGGIGLTPFMSMLPSLRAQNISFHLHVCTRSRATTPFIEDLDAQHAEGLVTFHHDEGVPENGIDLGGLLERAEDGVHAYCCGPQPLLDAFLAATRHWPATSVHLERFGAMDAAGPAYEIALGRSERLIEVREGETMANALKRNGIDVKTSCEAGICGICKVEYISGDPDHRDHVLTEEERKHCLMPCVSSSKGTKLVLDL